MKIRYFGRNVMVALVFLVVIVVITLLIALTQEQVTTFAIKFFG